MMLISPLKHWYFEVVYRLIYSRAAKQKSSLLNRLRFNDVGYRMGDRGIGFRFPTRGKNLSHLHSFQTASGSHLAAYVRSTGESQPGSKAASVKRTTPLIPILRLYGALPQLPIRFHDVVFLYIGTALYAKG
jgi:hypothetical protein